MAPEPVKLSRVQSGVVDLASGRDGPIVGVVANIHGDEPVGGAVARWLAHTLHPVAGTVRIVDANPEASFLGRRYLDVDMNRIFQDEVLAGSDQRDEVNRARQLLPHLLKCKCVIDLHSTSAPSAQPFLLSWPGSEELASKVSLAKTYGWLGFVDGTLVEYLSARGVPAIALEAGQHDDDYTHAVAKHAVAELLENLEVAAGLRTDLEKVAAALGAYRVVAKHTVKHAPSFHFAQPYGSFDRIGPGSTIARDDHTTYVAPDTPGLRILMPASTSSIRTGRNIDAFFLIEEINNN